MRNLSVMEQKQVVGGVYYYKIFRTNGEYMGIKVGPYDDKDACIRDCAATAASYGYGYCGRVYDGRGNIVCRL